MSEFNVNTGLHWPSYKAMVVSPQVLADAMQRLVDAFMVHHRAQYDGPELVVAAKDFARFCGQNALVGGRPLAFSSLMTAVEDACAGWPGVEDDGVFDAFVRLAQGGLFPAQEGLSAQDRAIKALELCRSFELADLAASLDSAVDALRKLSMLPGLPRDEVLALTELMCAAFSYAGFLTDVLHGRIAPAVHSEDLYEVIIDLILDVQEIAIQKLPVGVS